MLLEKITINNEWPDHMKPVLTDQGILHFNTQRGMWQRENGSLVIENPPQHWYRQAKEHYTKEEYDKVANAATAIVCWLDENKAFFENDMDRAYDLSILKHNVALAISQNLLNRRHERTTGTAH